MTTMTQSTQPTPLSQRQDMGMQMWPMQVIEYHFRYPMASMTKNPNEKEPRADRAHLYMRHLRWYMGGRYYSQLEVVGVYAEIAGVAYQDSYLTEAESICLLNFGPNPMEMDGWVQKAAKEAARLFPEKAQRFNIVTLDEEGNPEIPERLTQAGMEQAYQTIRASFHVENRQELADLYPVGNQAEGAEGITSVQFGEPQIAAVKAKIEVSDGKGTRDVPVAPAAQMPPTQ